jgi:flagellar biogenesis protein FliO
MIFTLMTNATIVQGLTTSENSQVDIVSSFVKILLGLLLILGIMLIFIYLAKQTNKRRGTEIPEELIKVLATRYLGMKKSISLVEVAGSFLALGISQDSISLLAKIENQEAQDMLKNYKSISITHTFFNQLRKVSDTLSSSQTGKG